MLNSTSLECVSPASSSGPTSVSVDVTTNGVDFSADGVQFRYVDGVSVSLITPSSGPVSGGTLVTI